MVQELEEVGGLEELEKEINRRIKSTAKKSINGSWLTSHQRAPLLMLSKNEKEKRKKKKEKRKKKKKETLP